MKTRKDLNDLIEGFFALAETGDENANGDTKVFGQYEPRHKQTAE